MSLWHAAHAESSTSAGEQEPEPNISSLLEMLGRLTDPRSPQGRRHELVFTLAGAVVAVLAGASNYRQVASQVADLPQSLLAKLGASWNWFQHRYDWPSEPTLRRVLQSIDAGQLDLLIGSWLFERAHRDTDGLLVRASSASTKNPLFADPSPMPRGETSTKRWLKATRRLGAQRRLVVNTAHHGSRLGRGGAWSSNRNPLWRRYSRRVAPQAMMECRTRAEGGQLWVSTRSHRHSRIRVKTVPTRTPASRSRRESQASTRRSDSLVTDPDGLRRRMVEGVTSDQYVISQWQEPFRQWQPSLLAVARHLFIPDTIWIKNGGDGPPLVAVHRAEDPQRWLEVAYAGSAVIAQVDDGHPGSAGWASTSSASGPVIVAVMLAALDAQDGHRVLEIGTGTGYNAALLAHRLGAERITSIELDPGMAAHACKALSNAGFEEVTVITGDGTLGYQPGAPYDRVISTAECTRIPYSWVAQTRPGGRILTPWANSYFDGGLVMLTVTDDGTAAGSIVDRSSFMRLRDQREPPKHVLEIVGDDEDRASVGRTDLHPHDFAGDYNAQLAISLRVPQCYFTYVPFNPRFGEGVVWLVDRWSRSWASHIHHTADVSDDEFEVLQFGPRRLWDEVAAAYRWWIDAGSPAAGRWRFTVTPDGQHVELS